MIPERHATGQASPDKGCGNIIIHNAQKLFARLFKRLAAGGGRCGYISFPIPGMRRIATAATAGLMIVLLTCCAQKAGVEKPLGQNDNRLKSVRIISRDNANYNTPVAFDLVCLYNGALAERLLEESAENWFETKAEYLLKYRGALDVVSCEIVPFSVTDNIRLPINHKKAVNIIIYVNYMSKDGQVPASISGYSHPLVILEKETYQIRAAEE